MLFYLKRSTLLEISFALAAGAVSFALARRWAVPLPLTAAPTALLEGAVASLFLTAWTLGVQEGYAFFKGRAYADSLRRALAANFSDSGPLQWAGAALAAGGEELLFRGLIQGRWGLLVGSLAFMLAHFGKKDIRVVSWWSFFQGLWLGALYRSTGNLAAPIVAHGLFDLGAMAAFRLAAK